MKKFFKVASFAGVAPQFLALVFVLSLTTQVVGQNILSPKPKLAVEVNFGLTLASRNFSEEPEAIKKLNNVLKDPTLKVRTVRAIGVTAKRAIPILQPSVILRYEGRMKRKKIGLGYFLSSEVGSSSYTLEEKKIAVKMGIKVPIFINSFYISPEISLEAQRDWGYNLKSLFLLNFNQEKFTEDQVIDAKDLVFCYKDPTCQGQGFVNSLYAQMVNYTIESGIESKRMAYFLKITYSRDMEREDPKNPPRDQTSGKIGIRFAF